MYRINNFLRISKVFKNNIRVTYASGNGNPTPAVIPRPVRQEAAKVVLGFVPVEWPQIFYDKTGVTGFYTFLVTFGTTLVSKEIYVLEHNYYGGLSMGILCYFGVTRLGPPLAKFLDKEIDDYEESLNKNRKDEIEMNENTIKHEEKLQESMEGQLMLVEAKRENVDLQLEEEFRQRQMMVYNEVKKLLDYQVALAMVHQRMELRNLIDYVMNEVTKSLSTMNDAEHIDHCIKSLAALGAKNPPVIDGTNV